VLLAERNVHLFRQPAPCPRCVVRPPPPTTTTTPPTPPTAGPRLAQLILLKHIFDSASMLWEEYNTLYISEFMVLDMFEFVCMMHTVQGMLLAAGVFVSAR
jgi:hypothetical protein